MTLRQLGEYQQMPVVRSVGLLSTVEAENAVGETEIMIKRGDKTGRIRTIRWSSVR